MVIIPKMNYKIKLNKIQIKIFYYIKKFKNLYLIFLNQKIMIIMRIQMKREEKLISIGCFKNLIILNQKQLNILQDNLQVIQFKSLIKLDQNNNIIKFIFVLLIKIAMPN